MIDRTGIGVTESDRSVRMGLRCEHTPAQKADEDRRQRLQTEHSSSPARLSGKSAIFDQVALLRRVARRQPEQSRGGGAQDVVFGPFGKERQIVDGAR
jgi:hypothetical protein